MQTKMIIMLKKNQTNIKINLTITLLLISNFTIAQQWQLAPETAGDPIAAISIYKSDPDTIYALGAEQELFFLSTDNGANWDSIKAQASLGFGTDIGALQVDPYNSNLLYASILGHDIESNDIVMSTDGGLNWKTLFIGRIDPAAVIEIDPVDNKTVYVGVGPSFIYRTTDQGVTWDTIGAQPPPAHFLFPLTSLAIAPSNDSVLYAGYTVGIYKSTDKGNTWQILDLGFDIQSQTLLAVDPRSADTVYAGIFSPASGTYSGGVYKSTDGGQTWNEVDNGLPNSSNQIWSLAVNSKSPDQLYIGLYGYYSEGKPFFQSTDGGRSWANFSDGLPASGVVLCIEIDTANNRIYCGIGSNGNTSGIYMRQLITDLSGPLNFPDNFQLSQNFPNPFNPNTIIKYTIAKAGHVQLIVFNTLGQKIKELVNTFQSAETYNIEFNATNLSSGVYFYKLIFDGSVQTKKMTLIR